MSTTDTPSTGAHAEGTLHQSNHVNLRVTYLHAGNPRPPHDVGAIPISTTIGELKSRLQTDLLERPRPEEQRLIYQGRPLMDGNVTLKEALRLEGPTGPLPYTIHIVIQPRQAPSHFRPTQTPTAQPAPAASNGILPTGPPASIPPEQQNTLDMAHAHMNELQRQFAGETGPNIRTTVHFQHMNTVPSGTPSTTQTGVPNAQPIPTAQQQHQRLHVQAHMNALQHHMNAVQTHLANAAANMHATPQAPNSVDARMPQLVPGLAPFPRPSSAPGVHRHRQTASTDARQPRAAHPIPHPPMPQAPVFGPSAIPFPRAASTVSSQPTVWLASSSTGPQALVFAPGHGFFTTAQTTQTSLTPTPTTQPPVPQPATAPQPPAAPNAREDHVAIRPPPGGLPLPLPQRPGDQNQADNDFWALVLQRGWLFLRLYMFIYVLSEPGTWRRYGLLLLAAIVCLLPRENPLNNVFVVARRHLDNLIGPPPPAQLRAPERGRAGRIGQAQHDRLAVGGGIRPGQVANNPPDAAGPQPAANGPTRTPIRGAVTMTPEEAARRLLRQQREQQQQNNPNVLRDAFYRVEQAVALFLASLVPGVGERHVAAREQMRREEERYRAEQSAREEEEKKRREEAEEKEKQSIEKDGAGGESSTRPAPIETEKAPEGEPPPSVDGNRDGDGGTRANFT